MLVLTIFLDLIKTFAFNVTNKYSQVFWELIAHLNLIGYLEYVETELHPLEDFCQKTLYCVLVVNEVSKAS